MDELSETALEQAMAIIASVPPDIISLLLKVEGEGNWMAIQFALRVIVEHQDTPALSRI